MVIDHGDLDRVAAETIVEARAGAVINASQSITGRYPNVGPLLLCAAGIPLVDGVGPEVLQELKEGDHITVRGGDVLRGGEGVASGDRQTMQLLDARDRKSTRLNSSQ